jgi:UDP-N-acetylmuramoylalanine--D-glutamate ligase
MSRQHTAIIGMGVTGRSCVRHLRDGALTVLDTRDNPALVDSLPPHPDMSAHTGVKSWDFRGIDRVVVSPGISLDDPLVVAARRHDVRLSSDIDLFFEAVKAPVFAITGTNGKSTVTSLAGELLKAAGLRVAVGGNLGDAALDLLAPDIEFYVLELSSFQIERMEIRPLAGSVVLNVTEDHIDRHGSLDNYASVKRRIFRRSAVSVFNRADRLTRPASCEYGRVTSFGLDAPQAGSWGVRRQGDQSWFARSDENLLPVRTLVLPGLHNQENFLAACAVLDDLSLPREALSEAAATIKGLPHRCEFVRVRHGVRWYNDSKATNVGATLAAVNGLAPTLGITGRIVLLAGGDGKGADFAPLRSLVPLLRAVILYGRDADLLEAALSDVVQTSRVTDLESAVQESAALALAGDCVVLAPACASLDMFANYGERGRRFVAEVEALPA